MALLKALLGLFARARPWGGSPPPGPAGPGDEAGPTKAANAAAQAPTDAVDRQFTAMLLGLRALSAREAGPAERRILEQLARLAGNGDVSSLVPRLPAVLPQLIGLVRRDDVAPRELAGRLERDPALVGEVVRMANSPRYRAGRDVANLQEAVLILGQQGLIQLVTRAAMQPIFSGQQGRFGHIAGTRLWDLSDRVAHACTFLCGPADRFQAYLAGMVANTGLIVALRALDAGYADAQPPDSEGFHRDLGNLTSKLSERIARHWNFHESVCSAVRRRSASPAPGDDELTCALRAADRAAKRHLLAAGPDADAPPESGDAERRARAELERAFPG